MTKILTVLGTRPEIIRLSRIIPKLDEVCDHRVVHTGQNYDPTLGEIFFEDLNLRKPNLIIDSKSPTFSEQISKIIVGVENYLKEFTPEKVLILGDTNSGLTSLIFKKLNIPVYHMEAGNRCYDDRVPEESNRKIIDNLSYINLPYTENSKDNLLKEGFHKNKVFKTGNPILEVLNYYSKDIDNSNILERLNLKSKSFVLVTAHRSENVDDSKILTEILKSLQHISKDLEVVYPIHPRTRDKIKKFNLDIGNITFIDPIGFFDFVKLEKNAKIVITDSGTVQEECCLFHIPAITIRETTERQETIECGSNILTGTDANKIITAYRYFKEQTNLSWTPPLDYLIENVSDKILNIILGK